MTPTEKILYDTLIQISNINPKDYKDESTSLYYPEMIAFKLTKILALRAISKVSNNENI